MKKHALLILSFGALSGPLSAQQPAPPAVAQPAQASANTRSWHDNKGRELIATFRGIKDDNIFLQTTDGHVYRLPLANLSAADQETARGMKVEGLGIPMDPNVAQAAAVAREDRHRREVE